MKNFLILGLLAALLFSVSAALSLWLNQSRTDPNADKEKDKEKAVAKGPKGDEPKAADPPKGPPKADPPPSVGPEVVGAAVKREEDRVRRRAEQVELVVRDLQSQRESTEIALRAVLNELKNVTVETNKLDALAADLRQKRVEFDAGEKRNIEKIAAMYDTMEPASAAGILRQMVEGGRLEMAAKILNQMKERNAARVLEGMGDPALALQVLEKMRGIRATTPGVTAGPGAGASSNLPGAPAPPPGVPPLAPPTFVPSKGP